MSSASTLRRAFRVCGKVTLRLRANWISNDSQLRDRRRISGSLEGNDRDGSRKEEKKCFFWRRPAGRVGNVPTHEGCGDGARYGKANRFPHNDRANTRLPLPFKRRHYQICLSQITHRLTAGPSRAKCDCFLLLSV